MTILRVRHVTTYRYRRPVSFGEHRMMFRPRDSYDQRLIDSRLLIAPEPASLRWIHDPFGNCVALARFNTRASELRFESTIRVKHYPWNVPDFQTESQAKTYPFAYDPDEMPDLMASIARSYPDPSGEIDRWVRKFLRAGRPTPTGSLLMTLTRAISESFTYTRRTERGTIKGDPFQFALDPAGLPVEQHCAEQRNRRSQPPQPDPGLVHALRVAVPCRVLIGYDLMQTSPRTNLKCGSLAAQVRAGPEMAVPKPTIVPNSARISSSAASIRGRCTRSNRRMAGCSSSLRMKAKTNGNTISLAT
jgi:hypothetical protein